MEDYLEVLLPTGWAGMGVEKRRAWFQEDDSIREAGTQQRDYISAVEVLSLIHIFAIGCYLSFRACTLAPGMIY